MKHATVHASCVYATCVAHLPPRLYLQHLRHLHHGVSHDTPYTHMSMRDLECEWERVMSECGGGVGEVDLDE